MIRCALLVLVLLAEAVRADTLRSSSDTLRVRVNSEILLASGWWSSPSGGQTLTVLDSELGLEIIGDGIMFRAGGVLNLIGFADAGASVGGYVEAGWSGGSGGHESIAGHGALLSGFGGPGYDDGFESFKTFTLGARYRNPPWVVGLDAVVVSYVADSYADRDVTGFGVQAGVGLAPNSALGKVALVLIPPLVFMVSLGKSLSNSR